AKIIALLVQKTLKRLGNSMDDSIIPFNEIDFILPSYRYNIQFSFTTKKGLPFIREYILRIVHLGAMRPEQLANYFDLSEREAKEALNDLVKREELCYNDYNQVELTDKSRGYFESLGGALSVSELRSTGSTLGFELSSLSCVSSQKNRLPREWNYGIKIEVVGNKIATRDKLISKAFQRHFQELIEDGYMDHVKGKDGNKPKIYKVESLNEVGMDPLRLKLKFCVDLEGNAIDVEDFDVLRDSSEALESISCAINKMVKRNNYPEVLNAIELLNDQYSNRLFSRDRLKIEEFIAQKTGNLSESGKHVPFIGALYSERNWKIFSELFEKEKKNLISSHQDGIDTLHWLIPSASFWGKSEQVKICFDEILSGSKTKGKKAKNLYEVKVMVPLSSTMETKSGRWEADVWKRELAVVKNELFGYIEGYLDGVAEVVLLENRLVAITYYLNMPETYRVPIPIGFISIDTGVINSVSQSLNNYLSEFHDQNHRKDLGVLK
ncbi:MAG: hypothetical protein RPR97_06635, partial [Colwellia sp.]